MKKANFALYTKDKQTSGERISWDKQIQNGKFEAKLQRKQIADKTKILSWKVKSETEKKNYNLDVVRLWKEDVATDIPLRHLDRYNANREGRAKIERDCWYE